MPGLTNALILLTILTERMPPPGKTRHGLLVVDGVLAVSMHRGARWYTFKLGDPGDLEKSPEVVADEVLQLLDAATA